MTQQAERTRRTPLSRDRVLGAAVALADEVGIEALSMRRLAQELGVVPMALYKHVANKEELLDGMVDALVSEIDPPVRDAGWKDAVRLQGALGAAGRSCGTRGPGRCWNRRTNKTPAVLGYMDSFIGHVPGRRLLRRPDAPRHARPRQPHVGVHPGAVRRLRRRRTPQAGHLPPEAQAAMFQEMAERYPNILKVATASAHDDSVVGPGVR